MARIKSKGDNRTLSPAELLSWAEDNARIMRLGTFRDIIPGGYMAAMAPALVECDGDKACETIYSHKENRPYEPDSINRVSGHT